jgi:23S rRNA (guanosine2251-2'-O)-methyltransferase
MRLVCGLQPVREAIRAHGGALDRVLVSRERSPQLEAIARFATDNGAKVERVDARELERLSKGARHQGAIAFAPDLALASLDDVDLAGDALLLALDEIEDPQNFGAALRSAVAFGARAVLWPEHHSAPLSAATFRASAGAVEHATLVRVPSLPSALERVKDAGVLVVGLDATGEQALEALDLRGPVCLVAGAEGKGLRKTVKRACSVLAKLPMSKIASLNVSVASAIAMYEVSRQRRAAG